MIPMNLSPNLSYVDLNAGLWRPVLPAANTDKRPIAHELQIVG
jgi:hypothetical protein